MKKITAFFLIIVLVTISSCVRSKVSLSSEEVILRYGLVGYWPFDGNAEDASGNKHHGEPIGTVLTEDRNGNPESAYYFDGYDNHIDIEHSDQLKPQLPISVAAWIRCDSTGGSIFDTNFRDNVYLGVFVFLRYQTNEIMISYCSDGPIGEGSRRSKSTAAPESGTWFHFIGVMRGYNDISIYINGVDAGGHYSGYGGNLAYDDSPMSIGRCDTRRLVKANTFKGALDQIRIYDRTLKKEEALLLYQSGI